MTSFFFLHHRVFLEGQERAIVRIFGGGTLLGPEALPANVYCHWFRYKIIHFFFLRVVPHTCSPTIS